jgi:hypothetical protein
MSMPNDYRDDLEDIRARLSSIERKLDALMGLKSGESRELQSIGTEKDPNLQHDEASVIRRTLEEIQNVINRRDKTQGEQPAPRLKAQLLSELCLSHKRTDEQLRNKLHRFNWKYNANTIDSSDSTFHMYFLFLNKTPELFNEQSEFLAYLRDFVKEAK